MTTELMPRRTLGSSDLQVSVVGLGTNNFGRRVGLEGTRAVIDGSLRRLRTDRVDLYQYHQPDEVTPIEETLETLAELRDEGKIRHAGCSNFSAAQLREAQEKAGELGVPGFVTLQNEYSLLKRG